MILVHRQIPDPLTWRDHFSDEETEAGKAGRSGW